MDQQNTLNNSNNRISVINRPIIPTLQKLMMLYLAVWSISPPLDIDDTYRVIALVCAVGWFVLAMANGLVLERIHLYALGFLLIVVLTNIIENKGDLSNIMRPMSYYMLVMSFIMNHSYQNRWEELRILVPVCLVLFIVFNIITFRELIIDPTLSRKIVRADEEIYPYMRRGIGGYALVYSQVFLFPLLVSWIKNSFKYHRVNFLIGVIWAVTYILLILNAGYSIAIVTTIISLIILLIYNRKSVIPVVIISLLLIILLVWLIGYVDPFREALLSFFDGTKVARKIDDIYNSLHGKVVADSIQSRIDAYLFSLQTIFTFPFIGGLWFQAGGGHSALLDVFAQFGVWGGYMYVKMFYCVPVSLKKETNDKKDLRVANAFLISLILVTLLDSLPYNMVFPVLIIAPILINQIHKWRKENEGSLDRQSAAA